MIAFGDYDFIMIDTIFLSVSLSLSVLVVKSVVLCYFLVFLRVLSALVVRYFSVALCALRFSVVKNPH
ncbi:MAG: hypothetical protein K0S44_2194 [Bacteroidetes bacterium]|nr:hypothetical protein [Bacteroidota bacterium]